MAKKSVCALKILSLVLVVLFAVASLTGCIDLGAIFGTDVHYYLEGKDAGSCKTLTGKILYSCVFVSDTESSWTSDEVASFSGQIEGYISDLTALASEWGVALETETRSHQVTLTCVATQEDTDDWRREAMAGLGYYSEIQAQEALESEGYNAAPIIYVLNKAGRSLANISISGAAAESVLLYNSDVSSGVFCHEMLHVFGARDFYYPDTVRTLAETCLNGSIMLTCKDGDKVDDLTAYLVGWTDTVTPNAQAFLDGTCSLTEEDWEAAREQNTLTGYGTKSMGAHTYTGDMVYGVAHGQGTMSYDSGDVYVGAFVDGKQHGKGAYTWADGDRYEGDWLNGDRNGTGTITWVSGERYEGTWLDDQRSGKGKFYWPDGSVYDGDWLNGNRTGKGVYTWANGDRYEGDWLEGARTGKGVMIWAGGDRYEGDFVDGERHGTGTYTWASGNYYTGAWVNGSRTGNGTFRWSNGDTYIGQFVDGRIEGIGTMTYADGRSFTGLWKDGSLVR